jgi:putative CocE/NonD family hydrolase
MRITRKVTAVAIVCLAWLQASPARAALVTQDIRFTASDGVELHATLGGEGSLAARPVIVEFSPYAPGCCPSYAGPDFNYIQVHIRGTGRSDGRFDSMGPKTQADVAEFLAWACGQPWSNGRLGLFGASASAIAVYHSLHVPLPCVDAAVLWSGTHELYRDLIYPGGVPNRGPSIGVLGLIVAPWAAALPERLGEDAGSVPDNVLGFTDAATNSRLNPTTTSYWDARSFQGDVNDIPILMVDGFFDVESRGAFQAFQALRDGGAHLYVVGAHDGVPAGTGGDSSERAAWFHRYLRDVANGVEDHPRVSLWLADGRREDLLAGTFVRVDADDWPVPGTQWEALALDPARSGSATSINDGTLTLGTAATIATQLYPAVPSLPTATDPPTTSLLAANGAAGFSGNDLARAFPALTNMTIPEKLGLSYTTAPLAADVVSAGPASLEIDLAGATGATDIWAIISDVSPEGAANPVAVGRLRTDYPNIDPARSLIDPQTGWVVQPYGIFDTADPPAPGAYRPYHVEFWPIGNRFKAGHRIRLHVVGVSAYYLETTPSMNLVRVGGPGGSRLLLPVLPGSDLHTALPAS